MRLISSGFWGRRTKPIRPRAKPPNPGRLRPMKPPEPIRLFLDSGAYSAWKKGETIDVRDYIKFVREAEPCLTVYANLDVIPGRPDRVRTTADAEVAAA